MGLLNFEAEVPAGSKITADAAAGPTPKIPADVAAQAPKTILKKARFYHKLKLEIGRGEY